MSARESLVQAMLISKGQVGWSRDQVEAAVDDYAHELAEEIRKVAHERYGPDSSYGVGMGDAANQIDPRVKE